MNITTSRRRASEQIMSSSRNVIEDMNDYDFDDSLGDFSLEEGSLIWPYEGESTSSSGADHLPLPESITINFNESSNTNNTTSSSSRSLTKKKKKKSNHNVRKGLTTMLKKLNVIKQSSSNNNDDVDTKPTVRQRRNSR